MDDAARRSYVNAVSDLLRAPEAEALRRCFGVAAPLAPRPPPAPPAPRRQSPPRYTRFNDRERHSYRGKDRRTEAPRDRTERRESERAAPRR